MDIIAHYFIEIYLIAILAFLFIFLVLNSKRNKAITAKYDESLEMSKSMMQRQVKIIEIAEESNKLLSEILQTLKSNKGKNS